MKRLMMALGCSVPMYCAAAPALMGDDLCEGLPPGPWSETVAQKVRVDTEFSKGFKEAAQQFAEEFGIVAITETDFFDAIVFMCGAGNAGAGSAAWKRLEASARMGSDFATLIQLGVYGAGIGGVEKNDDQARRLTLEWLQRSPNAAKIMESSLAVSSQGRERTAGTGRKTGTTGVCAGAPAKPVSVEEVRSLLAGSKARIASHAPWRQFEKEFGISVRDAELLLFLEFACWSGNAGTQGQAWKRLNEAARGGSDFASLMVYGAYLEGMGGIEVDERQANRWMFEWLGRSPRLAQQVLSERGVGVRGSPAKVQATPEQARALQTRKAAGGDVAAMVELAALHSNAQRKKEALPWLHLAAAAQQPQAALMLSALHLLDWQGTAVDLPQARHWAQQAVERKLPSGYFVLGLIALTEPGPNAAGLAQAVSWFQKGAQLNDRDCIWALKQMQSDGLGMPRDAQSPNAWERKVAGSTQSPLWGSPLYRALWGRLAQALDQGRESEWLARAHQGVLADQEAVGLRLAERKDPQAVQWLRKAAAQGSLRAMRELGAILANGEGDREAVQEGVHWFRQAAAQGDLLARSWLASAYQLGVVVPRSLPLAYAMEYAAAVAAKKGGQGAPDLVGFDPWVKTMMSEQELQRGQRLATALLQPGQFLRVLEQGAEQ